jgi:hypothetical protein
MKMKRKRRNHRDISNMTKKRIKEESELRVDLFNDFFDLCEEKGISLSSDDFSQISRFAVKDGFITYGASSDGLPVKSLIDLDIENISNKEAKIIVKRARTALKRILEMKTKYIAGPFHTSRHFRRMQKKLNKTSKRTNVASQ